MPTITELANTAGIQFRALIEHAGLPPAPAIMLASVSGFDVALTLIEQSTGAKFADLDDASAERVISYFVAEAGRTEDRHVAAFYHAWALTLWKAYPIRGGPPSHQRFPEVLSKA
jgi:hypothetical protein